MPLLSSWLRHPAGPSAGRNQNSMALPRLRAGLQVVINVLAIPPSLLAFYLRWGTLMWLARPGNDAANGARRWVALQRFWGATAQEVVMGQLDYWTIRIFRKASPFRLKRFLLAPFGALMLTSRTALAWTSSFHRESGIPVSVQIVDMWLLQLRYPVTLLVQPQLYYDHRLYLPERRRETPYIISKRQHNLLIVAVNRCRCLGKREFARLCEAAQVPYVRSHAEIDRGGVVRWLEGRSTLPPEDLFSKPEDGAHGEGARRWLYQPDGRYRAESGALLDGDAVLETLRAEARGRAILIQPRVRNHARIEEMFGPTLATVRYVTELLPDMRVEPVLAVHRSASCDSPVDNYEPVDRVGRGGVACAVDLETGTLQDRKSVV